MRLDGGDLRVGGCNYRSSYCPICRQVLKRVIVFSENWIYTFIVYNAKLLVMGLLFLYLC